MNPFLVICTAILLPTIWLLKQFAEWGVSSFGPLFGVAGAAFFVFIGYFIDRAERRAARERRLDY